MTDRDLSDAPGEGDQPGAPPSGLGAGVSGAKTGALLNGLVLGPSGLRWRLFASLVAATRALRLPVLIIGSGDEAVRALHSPALRHLPVSGSGRPGDTRAYRRAIERFLDGDPVDAAGGGAGRAGGGDARGAGRGGAAAVLAPGGAGVAEVAWFLLREALQRRRLPGAVGVDARLPPDAGRLAADRAAADRGSGAASDQSR